MMIIKGLIEFEDEWLSKRIYIKNNEDKIDLFSCWNLGSFENKFVSCRYVISNKPIDSFDNKELFMLIHGFYETDDREIHISEMTSSSYNAGIIGGHDLFNELQSYDGRYILIEVEEVPKPYWLS